MSADLSDQVTAVGAVYDLIWKLELPPFLESEPLDELVVRAVLMALTSYLNHRQLKTGRCHVFPSDELIAEQIHRGHQQVGRVLDYLVRVGLIVLMRKAASPGRNRPGRPPIYSLPIDQWQRRQQRIIRRRNGSVTGDQPIAGPSPVTNGLVTGDRPNRNGLVTGDREEPMGLSPVTTEPGHTVNPATARENPTNEPGHARARARSKKMGLSPVTDPSDRRPPQGCLPGFSALELDRAPGALSNQDESAAAAARVLERFECPDCHGLVDRDGNGHRACYFRGRPGEVRRCVECRELVDESQRWHTRRCPVRLRMLDAAVS